MLRSDAPNWVYQYANPCQPGKWTQILPEVVSEALGDGGEHGHGGGDGDERGKGRVGLEVGPSEPSVPLPRYAHQVVYDERTKKVYMHGGNAGEGRGLGGEEKENEDARGGGGSDGTGVSTRGEETEDGGEDGAGGGDWTGGDAGGEGGSRSELRETRLDDFWVMNLVR